MTASLLLYWHVAFAEALPTLFEDNVQHLYDIEKDTQNGCAAHDVEENLLLCGLCNVAVYSVGARAFFALQKPRHFETTVDDVEDDQRTHLKGSFEEEAHNIGGKQASVNPALVVIKLFAIFGFSVLTVAHMKSH